MLPVTVLVGTEDDILAQFASALFVDPSEYDDAWEMVDKTLNGAIGYGMSVAAVSAIIRRGRFGMDGLCDWLETCILEYGINPNLICHAKGCSKNQQVGGSVIGIVGKMQVFELGNSPRSGGLVEL